MTDSPYGKYVEGKNLLDSLAETPDLVATTVSGWTLDQFERRYAPGKWSARQLLVHLGHVEMVFAVRLRFALAASNYVVQPFDQDDWMRAEPRPTAHTALAAYRSLRHMTLALCRPLTPAQRARPLSHPEFGVVDVEWVMRTLAGHERHHLPQFAAIAAAG